MTNAWISVVAAAVLLLPGWVVWRLIGPRGMAAALQIAPAFALSMVLISLIGWGGYLAGIGFGGVKTVSIALVVLSALASPIALLYRRPATKEAVTPAATSWVALAIAVGAALSGLYSGPWLSATADSFYHLAAIRSITQHLTALPQQVFFSTKVPAPDPTSGTWHLALALVSNLSGQDPVAVWRVLTVALPPLIVLAFFTLALAITRSGVAALIGTALYMVLGVNFDFRDAVYPNQFGNILAWLALAFLLRFVDNGSRRELMLAALIAFAASATHPLLAPFLLAALAGAVAAAVLVRSPAWKRLAIAAAVVGAATVPLLIADTHTVYALAPYAPMASTSPLPLRVIHHPWTWVWPSNWYDNPGTILGTAFAVMLVRLWRAGEVGAGLVIAVVLAIPAAALTPLFATTYSGQYLLARVSYVLHPLAWVAWAWAVALAIGALRGRWKMPAAAVLVISTVAAAGTFYFGPFVLYRSPASSPKSIAYSRSTDLTVAWRDRLAAIDKLPRSSVLLAEPRMAYEVAGLTGIEVVAVPYAHFPSQMAALDGAVRRVDATDAVQGRLDSFSLAGVLEHYGVTDVLVDMDRTGPAAWDQLANAQILTVVASGDRWRLYSYDPRMLDQYLNLPANPGPGPELARSGLGPQQVQAGRAVFARLEWSQGASGSARLQADALGSTASYSRTIDAGNTSSTGTVALPIPSDAPIGQYRLSVVTAGGQTLGLGEFEVGHSYQAEEMGGVTADGTGGWTIVGGPAYQAGAAASAINPGSATHQTIRPIDAGRFCVGARVYDDGSGRSNVLQVTVGGADASLTWSGLAAGVRWVRAPITLERVGGQLGTRLMARSQSAAVVDALEIYPLVEGACSSG
ncbi:MAG TPA: DUF6541 family protein [Candidatus Dormibacteraeota bacterium]